MFLDVEGLLLRKQKQWGTGSLLRFFREIYLREIDKQWMDHLQTMDHLRDGIGLRGYGQRDPKLEFKKEGFDMFKAMMANVSSSVAKKLFHVQFQSSADVDRMQEAEREQARAVQQTMRAVHPSVTPDVPVGDLSPEEFEAGLRELGIDPEQISAVRTRKPKAKDRAEDDSAAPAEASSASAEQGVEGVESVRKAAPKLGRNDPCWCGSGKKFKKCHGATEAEAE
jgi:preprotein translocase subunit SecA